MQKLILSLALITCSLAAFSQTTYKVDASGNYVVVKPAKDTTKPVDRNTGKTFTDSKGNIWPVFESRSKRLYALRTSKTGNKYKVYLDNASKK